MGRDLSCSIIRRPTALQPVHLPAPSFCIPLLGCGLTFPTSSPRGVRVTARAVTSQLFPTPEKSGLVELYLRLGRSSRAIVLFLLPRSG